MEKRFDIVLEIINSNAELKWFFNWYINHNNSLTLPYHNLNHTLGMMQLIIDIVQQSRKHKYGFVLDDRDMFILLLSGLFHDFNHSGGRFFDKVNIENAKTGLKNAIESRYSMSGDSMQLYKECADLIDATEYPYVISDSDLSVNQMIIRELDILTVLYDDFLTQSVFGLAEEMKWQDFLVCFSKYTKFLLDSFEHMKLDYSIELFNDNKDKFLTTIENYVKILKT